LVVGRRGDSNKMAKKNVVDQRQFKGGYAPIQPVDEWNRSYRTEPNSPSGSRRRDSVQPGSQTAARPGQVGWSDRPPIKKRSK
jgi:hypothetical protein